MPSTAYGTDCLLAFPLASPATSDPLEHAQRLGRAAFFASQTLSLPICAMGGLDLVVAQVSAAFEWPPQLRLSLPCQALVWRSEDNFVGSVPPLHVSFEN